jgi:integrase
VAGALSQSQRSAADRAEDVRKKADAGRYLSRIESDLDRGVLVDHRLGKVTVREWADRFMPTTAHLKPKTRASYASLLSATILPVLGDVPVGRLRPIEVQEWASGLAARGLSASRVRQSYRLLSQMMAAAEDSGLVATTPCCRIRLPRVDESEPRVLTRQTSRCARRCMPASVRPASRDTYSGLRIGEALALRRNSVDLLGMRLIVRQSLSDANGQLTFETPKNHQQRSVTMPAFLVQRLDRHLAEHVDVDALALLFTGATGQPLRYSSVLRRAWQPAILATGLHGVTPHDLRATHASWVIDEGGSVMDAAARLGHVAGTVTTRH